MCRCSCTSSSQEGLWRRDSAEGCGFALDHDPHCYFGAAATALAVNRVTESGAEAHAYRHPEAVGTNS